MQQYLIVMYSYNIAVVANDYTLQLLLQITAIMLNLLFMITLITPVHCLSTLSRRHLKLNTFFSTLRIEI